MRVAPLLVLVLAAALAVPAGARAQQGGDARRKLQAVQRELREVAAERRRLEGQRGDAARRLRQVDEQLGASSRALHETEQQLARDSAALAGLQQRQRELQAGMATRRAELAALLRAADRQGVDAPLKVLLAQDRVADGQRLLAYHRYYQRDRARRVAELAAQLQEAEALEQQIVQRRARLADAHARQRAQLGQLERDRQARAGLVASLDARYADRRDREQALGRDARALEQLLQRLRAAAAKAEAERRAEAARQAKAARAARATPAKTPRSATGSAARAPAPQVGGLGWPASGALLAGYGGAMPDGRRSDGLLIAAAAGAPVHAVANGTVVYAGWMTGYGQLLIVDHGNGTMSLYAHNEALLRNVGDAVRLGETVATVGASGGHGRPALYFELRRNGAPVDPRTWLRR